jgi:dTDP-glucose 4,6-dehydratase/UDP-glucose 4-epimerase
VRIVVTGGRGFLGTRICAALVERGHGVLAVDSGFRGRGEPPTEVEAVEGDVRDAIAMRAVCRGAEVVVHLAAVQGTRNFYEIPDVVLDINLRGTLNVAEACAGEGVRRLFFSSSSECYGVPDRFPTPEDAPLVVPDPRNPRWSYGGSKIAGELVVVNWAQRHGFEYVIARYHNVYGPGMGWDHVIPQFIRRLETGGEFTVQGDGEQRRSFCYVDDAVDATVEAIERPRAAGEIFNIGNPAGEYSINDLVRALEQVSGRTIEPRHVPFEGEGTRRRLPDVSRAERLLEFRPRVPFEEGLARTYEWYATQLREEART